MGQRKFDHEVTQGFGQTVEVFDHVAMQQLFRNLAQQIKTAPTSNVAEVMLLAKPQRQLQSLSSLLR